MQCNGIFLFPQTFLKVVSMDLLSMVVNNEELMEIILLITRLIVIDITPLRCFVTARALICNYPLLKDISFNAKCLLVWCD